MAYDISKAIARIEKEITESLIRNLKHHRAEETKEGFEWMQWQTVQLKELDRFKKQFSKKLNKEISRMNPLIGEAINKALEQGKMDEEVSILKALKGAGKRSQAHRTRSTFFTKDDKIDKLIEATTNDIAKAEHAILRRADDQYRRIIFDAQMYAASGAGTYAKAVDMATHDFLRAGINCVQYKNGTRVSAAAYAEMAIRTAMKRAYLQGQGEMRQEWGISTVILNKRTSACPLCAPFVGKVFIDDVWSGGKKSDGKYPLLSKAIEAGLYHPNCKDAHTTYFPGISTPPYDLSTRDLAEMEKTAKKEAHETYCKSQEAKCARLAMYSLDEDKQRKYAVRRDAWGKKNVELSDELKSAAAIAEEIKTDISRSISQAEGKYGFKIHCVEYAPFAENRKAPFTYVPYNEKGMYKCKLNVNTLFDWNNSLDSFNERIYNKNYKKGILASKTLSDLILHEYAHFLTFSHCNTWSEFLVEEVRIRRKFIPGISLYNDAMKDGAETIAEGFVALINGRLENKNIELLIKEELGRYLE